MSGGGLGGSGLGGGLRGGKPLVVPKGCADAAADPPSQSSGASDPVVASGASLSEARPADVFAPSVIHQGTRQHCAALGIASALAACGFADVAKLLEGGAAEQETEVQANGSERGAISK